MMDTAWLCRVATGVRVDTNKFDRRSSFTDNSATLSSAAHKTMQLTMPQSAKPACVAHRTSALRTPRTAAVSPMATAAPVVAEKVRTMTVVYKRTWGRNPLHAECGSTHVAQHVDGAALQYACLTCIYPHEAT